jgi:glycosyltransferase involved in cell wall biosynthesis
VSPPRVSVVLPVFEAAPTLRRALDSIRVQSFRDWELVAVDDGSTDASPSILAEVARIEPRLRVVSRVHAGIVSALNAGVELARGDLVARMDADDESHPERLTEQVALLARHPEIGVAGCLVAFGGDRADRAGYAAHVDWLNTLVTPDAIELGRFVDAPFAHPSVVFRRSLVARWGGYREGDFPEDHELWLRWLEAGVRMAKVPRALFTWHDRPDRLSRTHPRYAPEAFYRLKATYLVRWLLARVPAERPILIWGAGRLTRRRIDPLCQAGVRVRAYIDIDPKKLGIHRDGRRVIAPDALPPPGEAFVLGYVANRGARELQRAHLEARGWVEGRDFLFAA